MSFRGGRGDRGGFRGGREGGGGPPRGGRGRGGRGRGGFDRPKGFQKSGPEDPRINSDVQIFVENLPRDVKTAELSQFFSSVGQIKIDRVTKKPRIWVYHDKDTGEPTGECTITYGDAEAQKLALQTYDGENIRGHALKVTPSIVKAHMAKPPSKNRGARGGRGRGRGFDRGGRGGDRGRGRGRGGDRGRGGRGRGGFGDRDRSRSGFGSRGGGDGGGRSDFGGYFGDGGGYDRRDRRDDGGNDYFQRREDIGRYGGSGYERRDGGGAAYGGGGGGGARYTPY